jgi:hypothetical protein
MGLDQATPLSHLFGVLLILLGVIVLCRARILYSNDNNRTLGQKIKDDLRGFLSILTLLTAPELDSFQGLVSTYTAALTYLICGFIVYNS